MCISSIAITSLENGVSQFKGMVRCPLLHCRCYVKLLGDKKIYVESNWNGQPRRQRFTITTREYFGKLAFSDEEDWLKHEVRNRRIHDSLVEVPENRNRQSGQRRDVACSYQNTIR